MIKFQNIKNVVQLALYCEVISPLGTGSQSFDRYFTLLKKKYKELENFGHYSVSLLHFHKYYTH